MTGLLSLLGEFIVWVLQMTLLIVWFFVMCMVTLVYDLLSRFLVFCLTWTTNPGTGEPGTGKCAQIPSKPS